MKRKINIVIFSLVALFLASCSAQSRLASRIGGEWEIEKYENRTAGGSTSSIENAGTIIFNSNGRGTQAFTTAIAHGGQSSGSDFRWTNTVNTVSITSQESQYPKVWIIVESGRNKQRWFSTDSEGNVQVMNLKKK
jgi:hypothetical protein